MTGGEHATVRPVQLGTGVGAGVGALLATAFAIVALWLPASAAASAFTFTELQPAYVPPSNSPASSLVTGDFNDDGKVDIAFDNSDGTAPPFCPLTGCVSVLLAKGDGTFTGPVNYPVDGAPPSGSASLAVGDLNGDGNLDLVMASTAGNGGCSLGCVSILKGNGDGSFQTPIDLSDGVNQPQAVAVGDFNGDGREDIAVANGDGTLSVLLNRGSDTFTPASGSPFPLVGVNDQVVGMTVANLTGHGNTDLVLSVKSFGAPGHGQCTNSECIEVLANTDNGTGDFEPTVAYPVDGAGQVAAADLRGTGVQDVLVPASTTAGGGFEVLLNQGNGKLGAPTLYTYPGAANPAAVAVADFSPSDPPDVAVADFLAPITAVFKGNGDGTFSYDDTVDDPFSFQGGADALAVGDFNGDCKPDLALASEESGVSIMRNDTPPAGSACPVTPPAVTPPAVAPSPPGSAPSPPGAAPSPPATTSTATTSTATTSTRHHRRHPRRHRHHQPRHRHHQPRPHRHPRHHRHHQPPHHRHPRHHRHHQPRHHHHRLIRVTERIRVVRNPLAPCTASSMPLRVTISLSPRAVAARQTGTGGAAVRVTTVVRMGDRLLRTSTRRTFLLLVPLDPAGLGDPAVTITATSSGPHIDGTRAARTVHFARCAPRPQVTG